MIDGEDPLTRTLTELIRHGDVAALTEILAAQPALAHERIGDASASWTALHVATDWPGHLPRVGATISVLVRCGVPVDGRYAGPHRETPLHWAASNDDIDALDALLDAGADPEADGAVLTGGTPLSDAVVFGQWRAARRLVERGSEMTLWQAAALGETSELTRIFDSGAASSQDVDNACWHACRAGSLPSARRLVTWGADLDRVGHDQLTAREVGIHSGSAELIAWLRRAQE